MLELFKEKLIRDIVRPYKYKIWVIFLLVTIGTLASLADAQFMRYLFDHFLTNLETSNIFRDLFLFVLLWISAALIARVFNTISNYYVKHYTDKMGLELFYKGYNHLIELSLGFHESNKSGEIIQRLNKARQDITQLFDILINTFFQNFVIFIVVFGYTLYLHWGLALVIFVNLPLFAFTTWWKTKQIRLKQEEINQKLEKISGSATESLQHIYLIKALGTEDNERELVKESDELRHRLNQEKIKVQNQLQFIQGTLIQVSRMMLIFFGVYFAYKQIITPGEMFAVLFYSFFLYNPLYQLATLYTTFQEARVSIKKVDELLQVKDNLEVLKPEVKEEILKGPDIEFNKVSFSYRTTKDALKNISLKIPSGKFVAFAGPTGSGKSTLLRLILRLEDVTKGSVLINNKDIRRYSNKILRNSIGIVPQETFLFGHTVRFNVGYGAKKNVNDNEIWNALKKASAYDFVYSFENKLETVIGERGVKLSGGQRQRLMLARAFLLDKPLLIFDEATSALDNETENLIKKSLYSLKGSKTIVMVAHRFSTIEDADVIFVLDKGRLVEKGDYSSLMKRRGLFYRLSKRKEKI